MRRLAQQGILTAVLLLGAIAGPTLLQTPWPQTPKAVLEFSEKSAQAENQPATHHFLVVAGGGAPSYNEIALEKNVQYFQRTLEFMGWDPEVATIFFANGNDGQATVRYLNLFGRERFKVPAITNLAGAANAENVQTWLTNYPQATNGSNNCPVFMYFTGHGALNNQNADNNAMILWEETLMSVQDLAQTLDEWPAEIPFVTMMAQCYSGAFANLIYEGGDPTQPVALQTRCGFFATVKTRPSVGCTPLVNEADYRDYSSSFFAGLSGRDRVGHAVASADYDNNGEITFAEAHAFAKVDEETADWPISTSEAWLQRQATPADEQRILELPMQTLAAQARPEQRYVISALVNRLGYDQQESFAASPILKENFAEPSQEVLTAYHQRLRMELINVGAEQQLRQQNNAEAIATLDQLLACESGSW